MHAQHQRNYRFFDAPVGLMFTIDRVMGAARWLDYGMFLQNIMVAARARGPAHLPAGGLERSSPDHPAAHGRGEGEMLVCGMSLGYADPAAIENTS
jgi:nitroreductase